MLYLSYRFCFSLILSFIFYPLLGQNSDEGEDLSEVNVSHQYDLQAPILGQSKIAMGANEATVFFKIEVKSQNIEVNRLSYRIKESYESENVIEQETIGESALIQQESNQYIYRFTIPISASSNYLFIFVSTTDRGVQTDYRFDASLNNELNFPLTDLMVMEAEQDIPIFSNFIPQGAPFRILSLYGEESEAFMYYYSHNFEPNPPPMAGPGSQVQKSLEIDSVFPVNLGERLEFEQEGLYFTQLDTTSLSGITFRIEPSYYPRFVTADKLIQPIRYISTSEEMDNLQNNENEKLALDRYWIKVTRSRERAREVIREYYRQVSKANILFTTYKEGWKTSQGMVYLLYGAPDIVLRSTGEERWIYEEESNLLQDMSFTFVKVKNIFTNEHYNLIPSDDYSKFWYRNIDLWRKGRKQI